MVPVVTADLELLSSKNISCDGVIMADELGIRKTVSFTHKQLGVGGSIVAAIMVLSPVKTWFFTREEGLASAEKIAHVEASIQEMKQDLTRRLERSTDKIMDRIKEAEDRTVRNADRIEHRIDFLEANDKQTKKGKGNI